MINNSTATLKLHFSFIRVGIITLSRAKSHNIVIPPFISHHGHSNLGFKLIHYKNTKQRINSRLGYVLKTRTAYNNLFLYCSGVCPEYFLNIEINGLAWL